MSGTLDIERLLRQAAPGMSDSKLSVEKLQFEIMQVNRAVDFRTRLIIGTFFLASFLMCLLLMIYCDIPWWLITVSFSCAFILSVVMWKAISAVF